MKKEDIEKTSWAKNFKSESPVSYAEAIKLACIENLEVEILHTDENGEWQWCIVASDSQGFWMDAFKSREEAVSLCKEMGWIIVYELDQETGVRIDNEEKRVFTFKDGQEVEFDCHVIKGKGIVRGIATNPMAVIGSNYIIEVLEASAPIPSETYPFKFIAMFECHLKIAKES